MGGDRFQEMSLDEIAGFRNGKAISPERYSEHGRYPVFGSNGQIARSDDVLDPEPVVAIGRVGAYCGSVHYIPEPSWVTDNAIVTFPKPGNDLRFLYYLLGHLGLRRTAIGSAQPLMTQGGLKVVRTVVPPLKQQQAIACILGALDDKIELNRRMNKTLEAMARAIFKSWFVDFLPVRAKVAARENDPSLLLPQAEPDTWFVYAIECNDGSLYIGQTEDLRQRWLQHVGDRGANWTTRHPPVRVPWWERQPSQEAAVEREKWLKTGFGRKWLKKEIAASARTQTGDPVRAKAAVRREHPRWTNEQVSRATSPNLRPDLAALFPDALEDSELGEIPRGWLASNVGQHFYLTMGQSPPGSTYNETGEGLPFYQGRTDFGFRFPTRRVFCTAPTRFADPGDTLVSVRAPVGDVNMASEQCAVGRGVAAICHNIGSQSFTYYSMHHLADHFGKFEAEGTVFGSINKKDFERLPFLAPPPGIVSAFNRIVSPLDERIATSERQITVLANLRDALLPKLISGQLRVPDAERIVGRCA